MAGQFPAPMTEADASARALLKERDFLLLMVARWTGGLGGQVQSVALGWHMYVLARQTRSVEESALLMGMIGLASFLPLFLLSLPAGEIVDRRDRRGVLASCYVAEGATVLALALASWRGLASPGLLLAVAAAFGAARAFIAPANSAMGPMLVPRELLPRAIAWSGLSFQTAAIAGPALGGVLAGVSPTLAYGVALALYAAAWTAVLLIRKNTRPEARPGSRWALIQEGLAYVWREKVVLGAISLDLFAVLLGGATALLPVFAKDILHVGASGFGLLRAAPAMGAAVVAMWLAAHPARSRAGLIMFAGVAVYGLSTCVFALSHSLVLSLLALATLGGADMLSVYVRSTLVQLVTPDHMRGRVSAVSYLFIGASNELGEFESGIVARLLGPVGAALFGGVGALVVTAVWARLFPALRKADRLD
jgi:MFS family permease